MCPAILSHNPSSLHTVPASLPPPTPSPAVAVRVRTSSIVASAEVPVSSSGFRLADNLLCAKPVHLRRPRRLSVTMAASAGGPGKCGGFCGRRLLRSRFCYCKCQYLLGMECSSGGWFYRGQCQYLRVTKVETI